MEDMAVVNFGNNKQLVRWTNGKWELKQKIVGWTSVGLIFLPEELKELYELLPEVINSAENQIKEQNKEKVVKIREVSMKYSRRLGIYGWRPTLIIETDEPCQGCTISVEVTEDQVMDMLENKVTHVIVKEPKKFHTEFVKPVYNEQVG